MIEVIRACDKPNSQNLQTDKEIQINLQQEREKEFAELAETFHGDKAILNQMRRLFDKQADKWGKRLLDSHKVIEENQRFYQEGRKIWMNDLLVLSRALRNMKGSFESILRDVLTQTVSVERKLSEILNEVTPFAGYSNGSQLNQLRELSSSLLLARINGELKEKVQEMAKFHEKIDSILEGSEWTKAVEGETSKTIERVSKYLGICSNSDELSQTRENLEDLKCQIPPNVLRESKTESNTTNKSITPIRIRVDSKKLNEDKKLSEFIGKEGRESQLKNIISANQSYEIAGHSNSLPMSKDRKGAKHQKAEMKIQFEIDKNLPKKEAMNQNPPENKLLTPVSRNNLVFQESDKNHLNTLTKSNKEVPSQNISYQSLALANRDPISDEINLQSEKNVQAFKRRVEDARLSPIARLDFEQEASMKDCEQNISNHGYLGENLPSNLQKEEAQQNAKQKPRTLKSFICGCK